MTMVKATSKQGTTVRYQLEGHIKNEYDNTNPLIGKVANNFVPYEITFEDDTLEAFFYRDYDDGTPREIDDNYRVLLDEKDYTLTHIEMPAGELNIRSADKTNVERKYYNYKIYTATSRDEHGNKIYNNTPLFTGDTQYKRTIYLGSDVIGVRAVITYPEGLEETEIYSGKFDYKPILYTKLKMTTDFSNQINDLAVTNGLTAQDIILGVRNTMHFTVKKPDDTILQEDRHSVSFLTKSPEMTIKSKITFEDTNLFEKVKDTNSNYVYINKLSVEAEIDCESSISDSGENDDPKTLDGFTVYVDIPWYLTLDWGQDMKINFTGIDITDKDGNQITNLTEGEKYLKPEILDSNGYEVVENSNGETMKRIGLKFNYADNPILAGGTQDIKQFLKFELPVGIKRVDWLDVLKANTQDDENLNVCTAQSAIILNTSYPNAKGTKDGNLDASAINDGTAVSPALGGNVNKWAIGTSSTQSAITGTNSSWDESAPKYVRSLYSDGYSWGYATYAGMPDDAEDTSPMTYYEYKLFLQLGNYEADNLVFYDYLERKFSDSQTHENEIEAQEEYLGTLQYDNDKKTFITNKETLDANYDIYVFYTTSTDLQRNMCNPATAEELASSELWKKEEEYDPETDKKVTAIAVSVKSKGERGFIPSKSNIIVDLKMQAPYQNGASGKIVKNRYFVRYDAYYENSATKIEGADNVDSNNVYVTFKKRFNRLVINKTDTADGNPLSGVVFQLEGVKGEAVGHTYPQKTTELIRQDDGQIILVEKDVPVNTNQAGSLSIDGIESGLYRVTEIPIDGYLIPYEFYIAIIITLFIM